MLCSRWSRTARSALCLLLLLSPPPSSSSVDPMVSGRDFGFSSHELHEPIDGVEVLRDQFFVLDGEAVFLLEKAHQLENARRVDDAQLQQRIAVGQRRVLLAEKEVLDDELPELELVVSHDCPFHRSV